MKNYLEIEEDVYFICLRLREIDKSYRVLYNLARQCYEVHSFEQSKSSYCFTVPYSQLDERTVLFALKTRSENRDKLIAEIEKNNQDVYDRQIKTQVKMLREALC